MLRSPAWKLRGKKLLTRKKLRRKLLDLLPRRRRLLSMRQSLKQRDWQLRLKTSALLKKRLASKQRTGLLKSLLRKKLQEKLPKKLRECLQKKRLQENPPKKLREWLPKKRPQKKPLKKLREWLPNKRLQDWPPKKRLPGSLPRIGPLN